MSAMKLSKRRQVYLLPAVLLGATAPLTVWPVAPVPEYLELRVDVRGSVDRVTDQLQTAGEDAGLHCVLIPEQTFIHLTYRGGVRCAPAESADGR